MSNLPSTPWPQLSPIFHDAWVSVIDPLTTSTLGPGGLLLGDLNPHNPVFAPLEEEELDGLALNLMSILTLLVHKPKEAGGKDYDPFEETSLTTEGVRLSGEAYVFQKDAVKGLGVQKGKVFYAKNAVRPELGLVVRLFQDEKLKQCAFVGRHKGGVSAEAAVKAADGFIRESGYP
jgi:hypothetical protein